MNSIIFIPLITFSLCSYMYLEDMYNIRHCHLFAYICLITFSFVIGVRVNFGNDQVTYLYSYIHQKLELFEPFFTYLNKFLYNINAPYQWLFIIVSFIEFYFLERTIIINELSWFFTLFFFFIFDYFAFSVNGLRQAIAIYIMLYSFKLFYSRKYFQWFILFLLACGFHKSSIIMIVICPFCKILHFPNNRFILFLHFLPLMFALIFYNQIWDFILDFLNRMSPVLPKQFLFLINTFSVWKIELGSGFGVKMQLLGYICILPKCMQVAKNSKYTAFIFYIFYFGLLGKYLSGQNMNLSRIFYNMTSAGLILFPSAITSIKKKSILKMRNLLFIFGICIFFLLYIYNSYKGVNSEPPTPYIWDLDFSFKKRW